MSYLHVPRLQFAGQFQADMSTVNNDPEHFDTDKFQSNYQLPGPGATNGWWNPNGSGAWRLYGCTVQKVFYSDGTSCEDPNIDPVVGLAINGNEERVEGKLVDLDPEQQMVSEIWGFRMRVGGEKAGMGFRGDFDVVGFADIWVRYLKGQPDSFFSAFYQSVLQLDGFLNLRNSRFLRELEAAFPAGTDERTLSVKMTVDGFNDDSTTPYFTFGRVVGSMGVYQPGEPKHFVAGRALTAVQGAPTVLNTAYATIEDDTLYLDLGNSLQTTGPGGPLADFGAVYLAVMPAKGPVEVLGAIEYTEPGWYPATAGICALRLTRPQLKLAAGNPLALVSIAPPLGQYVPLLMEASNGQFVRADSFVFRFNPGKTTSETQTARFYATTFGQPAKKLPISLIPDVSIMQGQILQGPAPGPKKVGVPADAFRFATTITTDANGVAELDMTAADPGNPRGYIDGQLYGIAYQPGAAPPPVGSIQNPSQIINALVFSGYEVPAQPNWVEHVQPIFQQYADLYPVMKPIVDLSNYGSVVQHLNILNNVFSAPESSPNYMPVTRDLSKAKRQMLLDWLKNPLYMNLDSVEDLHVALQTAIELEHSTIPPYLSALYSIKPGKNVEVYALIRSVVMEEMLHMALASNLLIAIGGQPKIGHPKFVPRYPGSLPGGLRSDLTVRLRRCSIDQIRDCFMSIEQPEEVLIERRKHLAGITGAPVAHPAHAAVHATAAYHGGTGRPGHNGHPGQHDDAALLETSKYTIAWFYSEIEKAIERLYAEGKLTFGNAERQVSQWSGIGKLYVITSLEDARAAIQEIMEQGEGRGPLHPGDGDHELAHYYKFAEIVEGRRLIPVGDTFKFKGPKIPFDPAGVWPMMDDPDLFLYAPGSRARILSEQFAQAYQSLLNALHRTFNGDPDHLREAIGTMYSLDLLARKLMETPSGLGDGTTAGPCFQVNFG